MRKLATDENIEKAAVALFTRHWQRAPDTRDHATGGLDTYRVLAGDVLRAVEEPDGPQ